MLRITYPFICPLFSRLAIDAPEVRADLAQVFEALDFMAAEASESLDKHDTGIQAVCTFDLRLLFMALVAVYLDILRFEHWE